MGAQSTIGVEGKISVASGKSDAPSYIALAIEEVEAKSYEVTIGAASTGSIPMPFSSGVDEAIVLALYSPKHVLVQVTGKSATPGPVKLGLKGWWLLTMAPGEGITALSVTNSQTEPVTLNVILGTKAPDNATPPFWE